MMNHLFISFPILFLFVFHFTLISSQGPAAAPAPAAPSDITAILKKDGRFTLFIHLLQSTKVSDNLNSQLNGDSDAGLTVFAPTDNAFSGLKTGTLNSYTDEEKVELVQFHVLPYYLSPSQFQTASNPMTTQAGSSQALFSMNVTMPPPPPPPPPPKKIAPKAKPASVEAVNSSTEKCLSKVVLRTIVCFMLAFATFT